MKNMKVLNRFFEKIVAGGALFLAVMIFGATAQAATITVTSNADAGPNTLRQAILDSNASAGVFDTINFSAVTTIALLTPLPAITDPVMIDGGATPTVELNGLGTQGAGAGSIGLWIRSGGTTVRGMVINRFGEAGIRMDTGNGNTIIGNRIGTNVAGTAASANLNRGILIVGTTGHFIGDGTAAGRNLISGNSGRGIDINAGGSAVVSGNYIGTNAAGTGDRGNFGHGIQIVNSSGSTIGGLTATARNVISGNDGIGVLIIGDIGTPAMNNTVLGNYIGVDFTGNTALGNDGSGVVIQDTLNTVGGTTVGARNVISGNAVNGVSINSSLATGNTVAGNYIGVGANGTTAILNVNDGVRISNNAFNNIIGGTDTSPGLCNNSCNVIANNGAATSFTARAGIYADQTAGTGNQFRRNSIFNNGVDPTDIGIDIGPSGATANDNLDPDTGANNLQNKPIVTTATNGGALTATLNSTPSTSFIIEFFRNDAADTQALSEGRTYVASASITTDASGNGSVTVQSPATLTLGQFITATATRSAAPLDTSEFSDAVAVTSGPGAPTAAAVSVGGRVTKSTGRALARARVELTGSSGQTRVAFTNGFGYFNFTDVVAGQTYVVSAARKGYQFEPVVVTVNNSISDLNFTASQ